MGTNGSTSRPARRRSRVIDPPVPRKPLFSADDKFVVVLESKASEIETIVFTKADTVETAITQVRKSMKLDKKGWGVVCAIRPSELVRVLNQMFGKKAESAGRGAAEGASALLTSVLR